MRKRRNHFQFDAFLSSSIIDVIETRKRFKEDASMVEITDDWNIYLVRESKFSGRRMRKKLSEDEINDYLKIENGNEKTVFSLADFKRVLLS